MKFEFGQLVKSSGGRYGIVMQTSGDVVEVIVGKGYESELYHENQLSHVFNDSFDNPNFFFFIKNWEQVNKQRYADQVL